jgi:hypothetical protein
MSSQFCFTSKATARCKHAIRHLTDSTDGPFRKYLKSLRRVVVVVWRDKDAPTTQNAAKPLTWRR